MFFISYMKHIKLTYDKMCHCCLTQMQQGALHRSLCKQTVLVLQKQTLLVLQRQTTVSGVPNRLHDTQHQLEIIHTGYLQSHERLRTGNWFIYSQIRLLISSYIVKTTQVSLHPHSSPKFWPQLASHVKSSTLTFTNTSICLFLNYVCGY